MTFNPGQWAKARPIIDGAWRAVCNGSQSQFKDKPARELWFRQQVFECFGVYTTKQLNRGRDFDNFMAHFEAIDGTSTHWQEKAAQGDETRLLYLIDNELEDIEQTRQYAERIGVRMNLMMPGRGLHELPAPSLQKILAALVHNRTRKND